MEAVQQNLPIVYTVIRKTWLSRALKEEAPLVAAFSTMILIAMSFVVWNNMFSVGELLKASRELVFTDGQFWRAFTAPLLHSDLKHLLSNSFLFFILGWFLYGYFGSFLFPLTGFIAGGVINLLMLPTYPLETSVLGASGIVFYLGGLWLGLYFLIQRQKTIFQRVLRVGGVGLALFMPSEAFDPSISYRSHFTGFALGAIVAVIYFFMKREKFRAAEVIEQVIEEPEPVSAEVEFEKEYRVF